MIKQELITKLDPILSNREIEVVLKRLNNEHITQTESNYLSRSIRPKLKSAEFVASVELLSLLDYRRKKYEREDNLLRKKVINSVKSIVNNVKAIVLFGSYIRNRHTNYRDIDVMIVLNKKIWKTHTEKYKLEKELEKAIEIKIDIQLITYSGLVRLLPYSPLLQTELERYQVIYGRINLKKKIIVDKRHLFVNLLESEYALELGRTIEPRYTYTAIRNCLAIELFLNEIVDNKLIIKMIEDNIGRSTADSIMDNNASSAQMDIALRYLKYLYNKLFKILR